MSDEELAALVQKTTGDVTAVQEKISAGAGEAVWDSTLVLTLSLSILCFGLIVLGIMAYLIVKDRDPRAVLRAFGVPLIIVAAIFLVVTGYSRDQIAPVIGLLGTIAGYLLGVNSHGGRLTPPPTSPDASPAPEGDDDG